MLFAQFDMDSVNLACNMDGVNMSKSTYHRQNLKEELKVAALELLDAEGVEAVGIRQVARKAGVAHSAPANHFKNKQALFTYIAREIFHELCAKVTMSKKCPKEDAKQRIHNFANTVIEYGLNHPHRFKMLWKTEQVDLAQPDLNQAMEDFYQVLISILKDAIFKDDIDVESQAIAFWSLVHGYVLLRIDGVLEAGQDQVTGDTRSKAMIDSLLNGFLK